MRHSILDTLRRRTAADPSLADRPESPPPSAEFGAVVDDVLDRYRHPTLGVPVSGVIYLPMLELLAELRSRDFTVGIVIGGGTEFVRRVSRLWYGVEPGMVVGTLIGYEFDRDDAEREFAYESRAVTFDEEKPITEVAADLGWTGRQHGQRLGNHLPRLTLLSAECR